MNQSESKSNTNNRKGNATLKKLFSGLQNEMIAKANLSNIVNHPVDKGDNAEDNWIKWFNEYFPKRYKAAKATIIDSKGNTSDQIDIVLYDKQYSYLAFNENNIKYLPAESVYAVFEVKQKLNRENMIYAGEKAESVRKLYRTSAEIPYAGGVYPAKKPNHIIAGILTTSADWDEPFGDSFVKCINEYSKEQKIDCGCSLQNGSFYIDYVNGIAKKGTRDESLVFFFLQLLIELQKLGTVPAIDLLEYLKSVESSEEKIDG